MKVSDKGVNTLIVKEFNTKVILQELKQSQVSTIKELANRTGLTVVTVKGILNDLIEQNRVLLGETTPSNGGRPSKQYIFNERAQLGLIIYTREIDGQDSVCIRVIDLHGIVIESLVPFIDISWSNLENAIAGCIEKYPSISAISIGIPGIELEGEIVVMDYQQLMDISIVEMIKGKFHLPVIVENDVNAAVLGHSRKDDTDITEIYLYFPRKYPPGAGIKINGKLLKGNRHFAGEVSWLPLEIEWGADLADSMPDFSSAASKVILSMTAVLDPDSIVLFGEFLNDDYLLAIKEEVKRNLPERIYPEISLANDFNLDSERGLTKRILEILEQ